MPAGNLHAYLRGTGVEIMAASDNVLRGGLTPKHVDVAELLRVLRFEVLDDPVVRPVEPSAGAGDLAGAGRRLRAAPGDRRRRAGGQAARRGPRVVLCLRGSGRRSTTAWSRSLSGWRRRTRRRSSRRVRGLVAPARRAVPRRRYRQAR